MTLVSIDYGGTEAKLSAHRSIEDPTVLAKMKFRVCPHTKEKPGSLDKDWRNLVQNLRWLQDQTGPIEGIGLALAGKLDHERRQLVMAGNIAHLVGWPLGTMLEAEFNCQVALGNDAEAAAMAESTYGVAAHRAYEGKDFVSMIWGTGVGGTTVRYPHAANGMVDLIPGEPGHIRISNDGRYGCRGCEETGHVEAHCGGANLKRRFGRPPSRLNKRQWLTVAGDMTIGLRNILAVQPVQLITFSGGIAAKQAWLLPLLEEQLDEDRYGRPEVRLSKFGASAGSLGALSLLTL